MKDLPMKKSLFCILLLSNVLLHPEKDYEGISSYSRNEVVHDNGNKSVTYEHSGTKDAGDYHFSVTFEHDRYDTIEQVSVSNVSLGYSSHESSSNQNNSNNYEPAQASGQQSESNNNSHQDSQTSSTSNSSWDADRARDRALDNYSDTLNNRVTSDKNQEELTYDNSQEIRSYLHHAFFKRLATKKYSNFYVWCKRKKVFSVGLSKNDLEELYRQFDAEKLPIPQTELEQAYQEHQINFQQSNNQKFLKIMKSRDYPFQKSLQDQKRRVQSFKLKSSTIGFMQAYNIDFQQFTQLHGLAIQHQLMRELINNLNTFADIANVHRRSNQILLPIIKAGASVSGMAQDYNQANKLLDAISGTNCSYGCLNYLQGMTLQAFDRCEKMATALSFFNCEITKYSMAAARGVAQGIVVSELTHCVMQGVGSVAYALAPELTASVYAGATSLFIPIALVAGSLCSLAIIGEVGYCGYLYTTDQIEKLQAESDRIKNFAGYFYNFDQAPDAHVENLAMLATTLVWPLQREAIFNHLMDMQQVNLKIYLDTQNVIEQTKTVTQNQLHNALEYIKNPELTTFNINYKQIFGEHIFEFFPNNNPGLIPAGMDQLINSEENAVLSQMFLQNESNSVADKIVNSIGSSVIEKNIEKSVHGDISSLAPILEQSETETTLVTSQSIDLTVQHSHEIILFQKILQQEIAQEMSRTINLSIDLLEPITCQRATELADLAPKIRQLQELAKYTNNFTNLDELIPEDIMYLNRVYNLQPYKE